MSGTTINPYRFGGQLGYRRDGANRNYVRARHLDTSRGLWLSRDPVPLADAGFNFYWYVKNNPLTLVDPSGSKPATPCCCQINSASLTYKQAPSDGENVGHLVTVSATMSNVKRDGGACRLKWCEKTDQPYDSTGGQKSGIWQDLSTVRGLVRIDLAFAYKVPKQCPSKSAFSYTDNPHIPLESNIPRKLCIKVVIIDGCSNKATVLRFNQYIRNISYREIALVPPGSSQELQNYCNSGPYEKNEEYCNR